MVNKKKYLLQPKLQKRLTKVWGVEINDISSVSVNVCIMKCKCCSAKQNQNRTK